MKVIQKNNDLRENPMAQLFKGNLQIFSPGEIIGSRDFGKGCQSPFVQVCSKRLLVPGRLLQDVETQ